MQDFRDIHDIHDIRPPVPVGMDPLIMRIALILLILLVLGCAGFFLYRYLKRRKAGKTADVPLLPLPLPPDEAALKALDSLGDLMLRAPRLYYFRLTEIVKRFIGKQFALGAPEMTTQELVYSIRDLGIEKGLLADTREFLLFSDTIKYAGEDPSSSMMQGHEAFVRNFIVTVASASRETGPEEGGTMFRFASPVFLALLVVVPLLLLFRARNSKNVSVRTSDLSWLKDSPVTLFVLVSRALPLVKYCGLVLLIVALARPQWGTKKMNVKTEGINIILALDLSESMAALDFKLDGSIVTRLEAVKSVVKDFIMKRDGDRIGMVVFGSQAFTQLPLTRDYDTLSFVLDRLKIGAAGPSTAIGDAIGISLKRLEDIESKSNIIVLLTDGKSNSGEISPMACADIAKQRNVKVYTIGVGEKGKAPFLVNDPLFGERYVYQRVDMDHETLKEIAGDTGGEFFAAGDTESLGKIYDIIDSLEKTEVEVKAWAEYDDLYLWFVVAGAILLCSTVLLSNTRLLRIP